METHANQVTWVECPLVGPISATFSRSEDANSFFLGLKKYISKEFRLNGVVVKSQKNSSVVQGFLMSPRRKYKEVRNLP